MMAQRFLTISSPTPVDEVKVDVDVTFSAGIEIVEMRLTSGDLIKIMFSEVSKIVEKVTPARSD